MSSLTNIEKMKIEKLFGMGSGYVSDFSNRTFYEFVLTSTGKNVYDKKYEYGSGSKANLLRAFWDIEPDSIVGKLTSEMLEYWKARKLLNEETINPHEQSLFDDCLEIVGRLSGLVSTKPVTEDEFIQKEFKDVSLDKINLDAGIVGVLEQRLVEIRKCLGAKSPLAVIFLCGSTLEGILLGVASSKPKDFNMAKASPKDKDGKVRPFQDWSLSSFIDTSCELHLLSEDVKKFSHALRDFRNYIHPYEQMASHFDPDQHTAEICWKVLQAAISQLSK